jgi:hypothetical protein
MNVLRGNLFVSQQANAATQNIQRLFDTGYDYSAAAQFQPGQVLDNVFPNPPTNTIYRFAFNNDERSFSGATGWQNKFSDDEQLTVTLDSAFKPGASPNISNADRVSAFFGMVVDLTGVGRSGTEDTWTKGAVQR